MFGQTKPSLSVSQAPGRSGELISRRDLLRVGGGLALGAGLLSLAACGSTRSGGGTATTSSDVQNFESYPGLHPATIKIGLNHGGQSAGFVLMDSHFGPGQQGPIILDGDGRLVWFKEVSGSGEALRAFNLKAETYLGEPVLTWYEGPVVSGHGQGHYEIMDGSYSQVAVVEAGNGYKGDLHEFFLTQQGTAFFTCYGTGYADLSSLGGGKDAPYFYGVAQEVDVKTGKVLFQWRSDEHVAFAESYAAVPKDGITPWDYFHINSISLSGPDDLLISSRHTWTVYKVSRRTGAVLSRMGGKKSDFKFEPGAAYAWQHDVTQQPDGRVTVFDNGTGLYVTQPESRGLLLAVDDATRRRETRPRVLPPRKCPAGGRLGQRPGPPGRPYFRRLGRACVVHRVRARRHRCPGRQPRRERYSVLSGVPFPLDRTARGTARSGRKAHQRGHDRVRRLERSHRSQPLGRVCGQ